MREREREREVGMNEEFTMTRVRNLIPDGDGPTLLLVRGWGRLRGEGRVMNSISLFKFYKFLYSFFIVY